MSAGNLPWPRRQDKRRGRAACGPELPAETSAKATGASLIVAGEPRETTLNCGLLARVDDPRRRPARIRKISLAEQAMNG
jgi:hypothetical protein